MIKALLSSDVQIGNFIDNAEVDLRKDFKEDSYLYFEDNYNLIKQIQPSLQQIYDHNHSDLSIQSYMSIKRDERLHPYAQKNEYCKRVFASHKSGQTYGTEERSEYQRDYERIVHSKSFRRLVDKAQIFTSSKGDHYRTRMTHTLEVVQIARAIALGLNMNVELTEAIAMAHDLGHTPFGHRGERTLDDILKNKNMLLDNGEKNFYGGFKHNFQGIRVVTHIEDKYIEHDGIDLSYQVLEGVLKHTKMRLQEEFCNKDESCCDCNKRCFNISDFFGHSKEQLFLDFNHCTTIEGQIVAIADEIAQRSHDLDDAFASGLMNVEELKAALKLKSTKLYGTIISIDKEFCNYQKKNRIFVDKERAFQGRIVSAVISFFIEDVISASTKAIEEYSFERNSLSEYNRFDEVLVKFSSTGSFLNYYMEKIISKKVINSSEVSLFDERAKMIITGLFSAYYNNPKLLNQRTLKKIYIDIITSGEEVIDFIDGSMDAVRKEISYIKNPYIDNIDTKSYENKNKILVRGIVDYISGMTDSFAINEYNTIYK